MPRVKRTPSPLRQIFGTQLRAARKAKELTIFDVAYAAHVDWSYVAQIETGKNNPSLDVMDALAQAVGLPLDQLLKAPKEHLPAETQQGQQR